MLLLDKLFACKFVATQLYPSAAVRAALGSRIEIEALCPFSATLTSKQVTSWYERLRSEFEACGTPHIDGRVHLLLGCELPERAVVGVSFAITADKFSAGSYQARLFTFTTQQTKERRIPGSTEWWRIILANPRSPLLPHVDGLAQYHGLENLQMTHTRQFATLAVNGDSATFL